MPQPQDPAAIAQVVTAFVRTQTQGLPGRVEVNQGGVDPRLSLTRCDNLEAFQPSGARLWGNSTVGVRSQSPERWSLFVPDKCMSGTMWSSARARSRAAKCSKLGDVALQNLDLTSCLKGG